MMNEKNNKVPLNSCLKRIASYESVFKNHKSFTEEIAEALFTRARCLGNSHPSVIIGREKRLTEGLFHVAEALTNCDLPKSEARCISPESDTASSNQQVSNETNSKANEIIKPDLLTVGDLPREDLAKDTGVLKPSKITDIDDNASHVLTRPWTTLFEEQELLASTLTIEKSIFGPSRFPFGTSDAGDMNWNGTVPHNARNRPATTLITATSREYGCLTNSSSLNNMFPRNTLSCSRDTNWIATFEYKGDCVQSRSIANVPVRSRSHESNISNTAPKRRFSRNILSRKRDNFDESIWSNERQANNSKSNRSLLKRIKTFMNKKDFKNFKQRVRGACSNRIRAAGDTICRFKAYVREAFKK